MSVTYNPGSDWTVIPSRGYARNSSAAILTAKGGPLQNPGTPSMSDPSTGAIASMPAAMLQTRPSITRSGISNISSFWFVVGLLVLTMWLESGKRGSL